MRSNILIATSRVILGFLFRFFLTPLAILWLGAADYGLWAAVSAALALMGVISEALSSSSQRQLTAAIASNDLVTARSAFSVSFALFAALSLCVMLIGVVLKSTFLDTLDIPSHRDSEASILYWISLAGMMASLLAVPFQGLLVASHRQDLLTFVQLIPTAALLLAVYLLSKTNVSPIIGFGLANGGAVGLTTLLSVVIAISAVPAAKLQTVPHFWVELRKFGDFAFWNLFGRLNWVLRNAGTTVLLSANFGNIAAAGFTVTNNLILSALQFAFAYSGVVQTQMTAAETKGNSENVRRIASGYSLTQSLIGLGIVMIVWFYGDLLLGVWLKHPPEGGKMFLVLAAIYQTCAFVSIGEAMIMEAKGQIRGVTIIVAIPQLIGFCIGSGIIYWGTGNQFTLPLIFLIASASTSFLLRPIYLSWIKVINVVHWLVEVLIPLALATGACISLTLLSKPVTQNMSVWDSCLLHLFGWVMICMVILYWKLPFLFSIRKNIP